MSTSPAADLFFEYYRVTAGVPAQLTEVDKGAGFDTCSRATDYRSFIELRYRGLREGDQLTVRVHTDIGRYAALLLTVHGNGTSFGLLDVDIRVWEPIVR